ncbi:MAG: aldehyde dehydrogenase family protein [Dialister sp.]|nr:aldehyde dehydrogenase family protein [Dialister sp.]
MYIGTIHDLKYIKQVVDPELFAVLEEAAHTDVKTLAKKGNIGNATVKVVTFTTKNRSLLKAESHKNCIDIIIEAESDGEEWYGWTPRNKAGDVIGADPENDAYYYDTEGKESSFSLKKDGFLMFFPGDVHVPGWHRREPAHVTKIIIKVPCRAAKKEPRPVMDYDKLYINGEWVLGASGRFIDVENPATLELFDRVPEGNEEDIDKAVNAAADAFPAWSGLTLARRIRYMKRFLSVFKSQENELIDITVKELGSPLGFAKTSQVEYQYTRTASYIELAPSVPMKEKLPLSTVYREPVGVVGCITPWNYPLGQVIQKIIPALLMGNTVVLKPSQHTPLSAFYLAKAFEKAKFPKGVFNLVTGRGGQVGNALAIHPRVNMISFTGSTAGGITVGKHALEGVKRISLELGGKSPYIVLKNDNYDDPIRNVFNSIFLNSGQTCTAFSRMLIPENEAEKIYGRMKEIAAEYIVGDPYDPSVKIGPLASKAQFDKVKGFIEKGIQSGAQLLIGGVPEEPTKGYYIDPVIFIGVDNAMEIAQKEIFGPVLCVITYKTADEAIAIANDTAYGLNAGVFGPKKEALAIARKIEAGNVYVNNSPRDVAAPFGGYKESGIGREGGIYGMLEFTQQKAIFNKKA